MIRGLVFALLILVLGIGVYRIWWASPKPESAIKKSESSLTSEQKAKVRQFWAEYRHATRLKLQGNWAEAALAYQKALKNDPEHEDALYYLGNTEFEQRNFERAVQAWRKLIRINPHSTRAHIQLATLFSCGVPGSPVDLDLARAELERALTVNREAIGTSLKMAEVLLLRGEPNDADPYLHAVLGSDARSVNAHYLQGYRRWLNRNPDGALESLETAIRLATSKQDTGPFVREGDTRPGESSALATTIRSAFSAHYSNLRTQTKMSSWGWAAQVARRGLKCRCL